MSLKVIPTLGRVVWYFPTQADKVTRNRQDPLYCTIAGVIPRVEVVKKKRMETVEEDGKTVEKEIEFDADETKGFVVNLGGFDFLGRPFDRQNVPFLQPDDDTPDSCYCEFPPRMGEGPSQPQLQSAEGMSPSDVKSNIQSLFANFRGLGKDFENFKKDVGDGLKEIRQRLDGIHDRMAIQAAPDGTPIQMPEADPKTTADSSVDQPPKSKTSDDL